MKFDEATVRNIVTTITNGGVVCMPTDTIFGLVVDAQNESAVEHIYTLKHRNPSKQPTTIIGNLADLDLLGAKRHAQHFYDEYWPGPVTIVHEATEKTPQHLHRGNGEFGLRYTSNPQMLSIVAQTGPLATSSANIEGEPPSQNVHSARLYFGDSVDLYVDAHAPSETASKIIAIDDESGTISTIRA